MPEKTHVCIRRHNEGLRALRRFPVWNYRPNADRRPPPAPPSRRPLNAFPARFTPQPRSHENRPPDAPRLLPHALPRGCLLDPALALAPSQVHPTARSLNSRRARTQQQNARLQLLGNASETKTGRHPSPLLSGKRSGHLMVRHPVEPQMSQKNSDFSPCATYPQICQGPVERSKVITQHSTPLTPLYPQIYLAVLFSLCDILNL